MYSFLCKQKFKIRKTCKITPNVKKTHHFYCNNTFLKNGKLNNINNNNNGSKQTDIFNNQKKYFSIVQPRIMNTMPIRCYSNNTNTNAKPNTNNANTKNSVTIFRDPVLPTRSTLIISAIDKVGSLENILKYFRKHNINITRIESRYSQKMNEIIFFLDLDLSFKDKSLGKLQTDLIASDLVSSAEIVNNETKKKVIPWFPMTLEEVDSLALLVLEGGEDLQADHPGFSDQEYRKRRAQIAESAGHFKFGDEIPAVNYTPQEIECWNAIWNKLNPLLQKHACDEYLESLEALQKNAGAYKLDSIPQLKDISSFLSSRTGFRLRPTAGLISSRHFLNGLAFKVFFCTQYIRHHSVPFYTPEPDVCHELVGHAPLFANPEFARFSQEIGLASIGATDEQIVELARCYWFSVEFGLCRKSPDSNERKAYGAGVLSSFGELEYSMSDKPEIREWDPFAAAKQEYPITKYQPVYYLANSFEDAKEKMEEYALSFDKPFSVRWDEANAKLIVDRNIVRGPRNMEDYGSYVGTE